MVKKTEPKAQKKAPTVPESVLKRRKRDEDWAAKKASAATDAKKKARDQRTEVFKRAESYVKEYRDQVSTAYIRSPTYSVLCSRAIQAISNNCCSCILLPLPIAFILECDTLLAPSGRQVYEQCRALGGRPIAAVSSHKSCVF